MVGKHPPASGVDPFSRREPLDRLLDGGVGTERDPTRGLRLGRGQHYTRLRLPGHLMAASGTLEQALQAWFHYKDLLVPHLDFRLTRGEHHCALTVDDGDGPDTADDPARDDLLVTTLVAVGRSLLGGKLPIHRAMMRRPVPTGLSDYERFFDCPLRFGAARNGIEFSPALLGQPLPGARPAYRRRLEYRAERLLLQRQREGGVVARVRERLSAGLGLSQGALTVERVAADLGMTPRTLQRRLREEGVQFARLRDQVRMRCACQRLLESGCDMQALALYLGFSDTANFYHAFKRWKGCAPGEYRRRALSG
ncbi:helix-turn-helix domain-containing protein [Alloalcanivorax sp. C16-1]|uniref:helix-turn-helix domain-containing protein n=1 Tax=Alloalcanivorax sp. C16-1 TaxID=3390051 RepID=UPI003970A76A